MTHSKFITDYYLPKCAPFAKGMKFTTQISPLLNFTIV